MSVPTFLTLTFCPTFFPSASPSPHQYPSLPQRMHMRARQEPSRAELWRVRRLFLLHTRASGDALDEPRTPHRVLAHSGAGWASGPSSRGRRPAVVVVGEALHAGRGRRGGDALFDTSPRRRSRLRAFPQGVCVLCQDAVRDAPRRKRQTYARGSGRQNGIERDEE